MGENLNFIFRFNISSLHIELMTFYDLSKLLLEIMF